MSSETAYVRWSRLRSTARSRTLGQTALYTGSSGFSSLLGGVATAALARLLTVTAFGIYSFGLSFLQLGGMVFEFGLFLPAARLSADSDRHTKRELAGAALALYIPVGLAFATGVFATSFFVDSIFRVHAGFALAVTAPLAIVYPFAYVAVWLCQGSDQLHIYSIANLAGQVAFVVLLLILAGTGMGRNATVALAIRGVTMGIAWVIVAVWLRPAFRNVRRHVQVFVRQAREYSFQIYVGRVLSIGTYNMDVLMLAGLTNARTVGRSAPAARGAIAGAIGLPITGLASALFPRMVKRERLGRNWLLIAWGVGFAGVGLAALLAPPASSARSSHDRMNAPPPTWSRWR